MLTLSHKEETLWRWMRICYDQSLPYGLRKVFSASSMDWDRMGHTLEIITEAGYCLDSVIKENT